MPDVTAPFGFPYPEDTDLVRDGAADIEALAEGVNDQLALGFQFVGTRFYTSSGTFAKADPFGDSSFDGAKLRAIRVRMVGGGGGGNGARAQLRNGGGAGGGGGFAESFITDIASLDASITVTRGDGGAGGDTSATAGSTGGISSFGALVDAQGGFGGERAANAADRAGRGGAGGLGNTAQFVGGGGFGGDAGFGGPGQEVNAGIGGTSMLGGGSLRPAFDANGVAGRSHGGGGSGAANFSTSTAKTGGAGAAGIVIVDVFA